MCGIAGFFETRKVSKELQEIRFNIMTKLFVETQTRGTDAAGFSYINKYGSLVTVKGPVTSQKLVMDEKWLKLKDEMPSSLIAHCRAMTTGSQMDNFNNHPLVVNKEISVIHNGMISNHLELKAKYKLQPKGQVDSEAIPLMINKFVSMFSKGKTHYDTRAVAKAINRTAVDLTGGFACAMLNKQTQDALYLFTHMNPTFLAYCEELGIIFFASTRDLIESAFDVPGNTTKRFNIFNTQIYKPIIKEIDDDTITVIKRDVSADGLDVEVTIAGYELDSSFKNKTWNATTKEYTVNEEAFNVLLAKDPVGGKVHNGTVIKTRKKEDWELAREGGYNGYGGWS